LGNLLKSGVFFRVKGNHAVLLS